ncbi:hypothetical protein LTS15_009621 [Exophiala xenobiotica]|nr:hypothetical protein LTS15_009621 [Exophiala xenobiotica]
MNAAQTVIAQDLSLLLFQKPGPIWAEIYRLRGYTKFQNGWIFDPANQVQLRTAFLRLLGHQSPSHEYEGFFKSLNQRLQPVILDWDQPLAPPNAGTRYILRSYGDIITLHWIISQNGYRREGEIFRRTRDRFFSPNGFSTAPMPGPHNLYDSLIGNSIELVVWIWLMIGLRPDPVLNGPPVQGVGGRDPRPWDWYDPIDAAVLSSLNPFSDRQGINQLTPLGAQIVTSVDQKMEGDYDREFSWLFNLQDIQSLSRIRVKWTDSLLDHLVVKTDPEDKFGKLVYIFDNAKWLRRAENAPANTIPLFYQHAATEALETLALLIPRDVPGADISKWYVEKVAPIRGPGGMWLYDLRDADMMPKRRVRDYQIWRHRLLLLEEAFGSSSSTFSQLFRDQRSNSQRWTFFVTFLSFVLALLLLLLTAALLALTGWLARDTHQLLVGTEADNTASSSEPPASGTYNPVYCCCPASPYCSTTMTVNGTKASLSPISSSQSPASTALRPSTTVFPDTYSQYDVSNGAISYDTQHGEIKKQTGSNDITTLLNFKFPNHTSGTTCQFSFWLGSDSTHSGSQKIDIFTSNAQPIENTDSWPYGNLRDNFAGRLMFSVVPGFAEFEAGFTNEAHQFPCSGGHMVGYELVGVNDEDLIRWDKASSGPYIISQGQWLPAGAIYEEDTTCTTKGS